MIIKILKLLTLVTNRIGKLFPQEYKPIHLCHIYKKYQLPIPKYLIGTARPPTVTTQNATIITHQSAQLNGTYAAGHPTQAPVTQYGFYAETGSIAEPSTIVYQVTGNFPQIVATPFDFQMGELQPQTTYSFRAYAVGDGIQVVGATLQFTTSALQTPKNIIQMIIG